MKLKASILERQAARDSSASFDELYTQIKRLSFQSAENLQKTVAEALVVAALRTYWTCQQARHGTTFSFTESPTNVTHDILNEKAADLAGNLGEAIADLPVLEAAHQIGLIYTTLLPSEYRSRHGVYYTPPALASRLLDQAEAAGLDWSTCKVLDPACGGSAFLVPAAERMLKALEEVDSAFILQNLNARLCGWEIDPFAAWLSRFFIEVQCLPVSAGAGRRIRPAITTRDSLNAELSKEGFDLVVGNPPFGRVRLSSAMRERYRRGLYGHSNLYGLFTELAVQLAKPGGLVSFLTPSSFLAGEYFKNLRSLLWEEAPPARVDFVESRKDFFEGVLQETVLATYRKGGARRQAAVALIHPLRTGGIKVERAGGFSLPKCATAPWILPRHTEDKELTRRMRAMPHRLADWGYKVSTGPLVWNRHKDQLRERAGTGCVPLVWAESVTADGHFVFRCEKRNHKPFFLLRPQRDDWLKVVRPCVLLQRTTAKEQHRRLIAAAMPEAFIQAHGGVTVENHLNMLLPLGEKPAVPPAVLAVFINSGAADRAFRCLSGSVAVSAYELESMPLPDPAALRVLKGLITRKASRQAIERACFRLYGLEGKV